jgi:hypothetical protein
MDLAAAETHVNALANGTKKAENAVEEQVVATLRVARTAIGAYDKQIEDLSDKLANARASRLQEIGAANVLALILAQEEDKRLESAKASKEAAPPKTAVKPGPKPGPKPAKEAKTAEKPLANGKALEATPAPVAEA